MPDGEGSYLGMLMLYLQSLIPVVMSGILAVYSLVIAVLIANDIGQTQNYPLIKYAYPWYLARHC